MQYALALKSNYPIGSGVTEATCKTLAIHSPKSGEKCKKEALFGVI
jgi:hypothetical protein